MPLAWPGTQRLVRMAAVAALFVGANAAPQPASAQILGFGSSPQSSWRKLPDASAKSPQEMELQAAGDGLERIEVGRESPRDGRWSAEPATDIIVRMRHAVRQFRRTSQEPQSEGERSFLEVQLRVVTGGRLGPAGTAQCDRFDGGMLVCAVDCNGGWFGLRRGAQQGEHLLVIGGVGGDGATVAHGRPGIRLGACSIRAKLRVLLIGILAFAEARAGGG